MKHWHSEYLRFGNELGVMAGWPMPQQVKVKYGSRWFPGKAWRVKLGWLVIRKPGDTCVYMKPDRVQRKRGIQ